MAAPHHSIFGNQMFFVTPNKISSIMQNVPLKTTGNKNITKLANKHCTQKHK